MASVDGVQRKIWVLALAVAAVAMIAGMPPPGGVLIGAGMVALSLWIHAKLFDATIRTGRRRLAITLMFVKLAAFLALGWGAIKWGGHLIDPVGFALGVTCLPLAALWEALRTKGT